MEKLFIPGRSHAEEKVLARDWKLEILTAPDTYTEIKNLKSFKFGGKKKDADTTDFDSDGKEEHLVSSRSRTLTVEANYMEDVGDGSRDVGQQAVETLADAVGSASVTGFRLTSPGGTVRTFNASAEVSDIGGKNDDPTTFNFELLVSGPVAKSTTLPGLTFVCVDAATAGATKIAAVVPALTGGNSYLYKVNASLPLVGSDLTGLGWAAYILDADIPVVNGNTITLVEVSAGDVAVKGGQATSVVA